MVDSTDLKILFELNWDARQSDSEIGKKLKTSKQVVAYRIKKLEKEGVIKNYFALIDWRRLGYEAVRIYLKWKNMDPLKEQQIYSEIKNDPFFMWTVKFEGEFDIGFYIWIKDVLSFSKRWFRFIETYRHNIMKYEIYHSVNMTHYPMKPLIEKYPIDEKTIGEENRVDYDEFDVKILRMISENSRISIVDIANKLKVTSKTIIYRIKSLEKKRIILGYNALIDTEKLGYQFYKIDFYLTSLEKLQEMTSFAKIHKDIVYLMRTVGGPDYEIEVMVKSPVELHKVIEEIRKKFYLEIEHYRFHRFEYTIKQVYMPGE
jgi:Lrp/AsnC family leucine-responsive transcriptional regulator